MAQALRFVSQRLRDTRRLGRALAKVRKMDRVSDGHCRLRGLGMSLRLLGTGARVHGVSSILTGRLPRPVGIGKSVFAAAFVRAAERNHQLPVPSPSFLLQNWYRTGRVPVCHMDFFRLRTDDELRKLGMQEAATEGTQRSLSLLASPPHTFPLRGYGVRVIAFLLSAHAGVLLIEWADKFPHMLPSAPLKVAFSPATAPAPTWHRYIDFSSDNPAWAFRLTAHPFQQRAAVRRRKELKSPPVKPRKLKPVSDKRLRALLERI